MEIKAWFLRKMNMELHADWKEYAGHEIIGETEKAYKLLVHTRKYNRYDGETEGEGSDTVMWCPKSCMTENAAAELVQELRDSKTRYENLLSFAKEHGLRVRNMMKVKTILAAIRAAGLEYNY